MANEIEEKATAPEAVAENTAPAENTETQAAAAAPAPRCGGRPQGAGRNGNRERRNAEREEVRDEYEERVVTTARTAKTVKGGKNYSFSALVVVGDKKGRVGMGMGKSPENGEAIRKGGEQARRYMMDVPMYGTTITHAVTASFCSAKVMIRPATKGTGVVAGSGMRAVLELAGVQDVLAKSLGSSNPVNVVKATFVALKKLRSKAEMLAKRDIQAL